MLDIKQKKLADVEAGYAVSTINIPGQKYILAGSEGLNGRCVLINPRTNRIFDIQDTMGGIMSIIPVPEQNGSFLAIRKFYPVFKSEHAEIVFIQLIPEENGTLNSKIDVICRLPYVHRIALTGDADNRTIIAATLCGKKKDVEDWSIPGAVYEIPWSIKTGESADPKIILKGLHRNHGLFLKSDGMLYVAADEGVFSMKKADDSWIIKKVLPVPTGDIWLADIDNDGVDELITIQPFHGDKFAIYHLIDEEWKNIWEDSLDFGHVAAALQYHQNWYLLSSSRSGLMSLKLYQVYQDKDKISFVENTLSKGVAAAQAAFWEEKDTLHIVTSSCGLKEISEFVIQDK
jgi:hypothetical protein